MKIENQVCSIELAKKLKDLGAKQESMYYWTNLEDDECLIPVYGVDAMLLVELYNLPRYENTKYLHKNLEHGRNLIFSDSNIYKPKRDDFASAFTVAELGEMLKQFGQIERFYNVLGKWVLRNALKNKRFEADTEANTRAEMRIYLLENKLLKANT